MAESILLVEDDSDFQVMLFEALQRKGFEVTAVGSAEEGLKIAGSLDPDLVLTDIMLPGLSGLEAIPRLKDAIPHADIIVMTGFSSRETALEAIRLGAYDYFPKPFSLAEMEVVIRRALEKRRLQREIRMLRDTLDRRNQQTRIIGQGSAIRLVTALIQKIAPLDATVLVTGESGTGKELVSDVIHQLSPRKDGPLVKVNCAAIPENLLESELFGHEKGAFTGAITSKPGWMEQAHGGTLLLDEIGDMPLSLQPKLLRAVEQKEVERLGGRKTIQVDVRLVAATNQDLQRLVGEKKFREDLYYRLNVASIHLPPLRERKEDIPLLCQHFLERINSRLGTEYTGLSHQALESLMRYDWPGNVRQLANVMERAAIVGNGQIINRSQVDLAFQKDLHLLPLEVSAEAPSLKQTLSEVEKTLIVKALKQSHGRQTEAAKLLGVTAKNLWNKLQKHNLRAEDFDLTSPA